MIINLLNDIGMRGKAFEYIARLQLRRTNSNNFIFMTWRFDSLTHLCQLYRIDNSQLQDKASFVDKHWGKCDLVECVLDVRDKKRVLTDIQLYEVKTRKHNSKRSCFDVCQSNHEFMHKAIDIGFNSYLVSMILFENWRFSFSIHPYQDCILRVDKRRARGINQEIKNHN